MSERGQASVLAVAVLMLALCSSLALVDCARLLAGRTRAAAAADAAALAGAMALAEGADDRAIDRAARDLVTENGARLAGAVHIEREALRVEVDVEVPVHPALLRWASAGASAAAAAA